MKPYYEEQGITIYCGDCREILPSLPKVDLVLTDPPYGMNNNADTRRFTGGSCGAARRGQGLKRGPIIGDNHPFDPAPWLVFPKAILWGSNHFAMCLPPGTSLVWIKKPDHLFGSFLSDAEVAWMKGGCGVYCFRHDWSGFNRISTDGHTVHQNQKPLALMKWCLSFAPDSQTVLDPFMGSGTTLRAAKDLGRHAIGIEIEEKYCQIAVQRLRQRERRSEETNMGANGDRNRREDQLRPDMRRSVGRRLRNVYAKSLSDTA